MNYTDTLFLVGRILFGGYFVVQAWNHFNQSHALTQYAASKNVPSPRLAVLLGGVLLLIGGLGILLWMYVGWAVLALAVFLVPVTFMMHAFWRDNDAHMKQADMVNFFKNLALLGAALMLLSF